MFYGFKKSFFDTADSVTVRSIEKSVPEVLFWN